MQKFLSKYPPYKWILAFCDLAVLNMSFSVALRLRFAPNIDVINLSQLKLAGEVTVFLFYSVFWIFVFQWLDLYKRHIVFTKSKQTVKLIQGMLYGFIGFIFLQFLIHPNIRIDSRLLFIYFLTFSSLGLLGYRLLLARMLFRSKWLKALTNERALIIGDGPEARLLAIKLLQEKEFRIELFGFFSETRPPGQMVFQDFCCLGGYDDIQDIVRAKKINSIYIADNKIYKEDLFNLIDTLAHYTVQLHLSGDHLSIVQNKVAIERVDNYPLIRIADGASNTVFRALKRSIDLLGAAAGIISLSPLFIFVAIGVKQSSPGPVLFKQKRVGKDGELFDFYKFRSMYDGSDDDEIRKHAMVEFIKGKTNGNGSSRKVVNETRITKFGRFIRKYSLDELPQLFNVLIGDMSLVGPRPALRYEYEAWEPWHKKRLTTRPGCTGLWQVSARSTTDFDDMVILDLYYIQNLSPWFDIQLILKTIPVMIKGSGGQ